MSLLRIILVVAVIAVAVYFADQRFHFLTDAGEPAPPPPPPVQSTPGQPVPPVEDASKAALDAAIGYFTALGDHRYDAAYDLLSRDSQSQHSRADFEKQGKQGMPLYDFKSAQATVDGDNATVALQLLEEPGSKDIHLIRETDGWKVIYRGGGPGMPYP